MGWDDKLENTKDEAMGAAKEKAGQATDNERMEAEGKIEKSTADLKQAGEKAKDALGKD